MFSLTIWLILFLSHVVIAGIAITWAARAVNSPSARIRVGILTMLILFAINITLLSADRSLFPKTDEPSGSPSPIHLAVLLILGIFIPLAIFRRAFKLSWSRAFSPWGAHIVIALAFVALVYTVIEPRLTRSFVIPLPSMQPTLQPGDRFWVNCHAQPRRFDLVAYITNESGSPIFIKRLVGLPNEHLRFWNNQLYVNDQPLQLPPAMHGRLTFTNDFQRFELGPNDFFLIGDDCERSFDSRMTGPVDRSKLIGVADFLYFPLNRIKFLRH